MALANINHNVLATKGLFTRPISERNFAVS
jgi:hypothetical protein